MRPRSLLIALLGAALSSPAPAASLPAALTDAVWVAYRCKTERECVKGTAFHVGGGTFYTNAHVAQPREGYGPLTLARGTSPRVALGTAEVVCTNDRSIDPSGSARPYDIAKVKLHTTRPLPPALSTTRVRPPTNARVTVIGYPALAWTPVVATGTVAEVLPFNVFAYTVDSGRVAPGSSGSPVLNYRSEVAGIHYASDERGEVHFAVDLQFADQVCKPQN